MPPSTLDDLLTWLAMAVSLANTALLLWLAFTVLLNAEHRTWGVWLSGGGLLIGGIFFTSHTAILGHGLLSLNDNLDFWWYLGLAAVIALPFVWYVVVLWYSGYWISTESTLYRRQRWWFWLDAAFALVLVVLLMFANPFPSYALVIVLQLVATPTIAGIPVLIAAYAFYALLSVGLSLDTLRRPGPSRRMMGDLARRRAKPWLMATSVMLLVVGLLVAGVMLWVFISANWYRYDLAAEPVVESITLIDLLISSAILASTIFVGQAIVCYEVFTGKTLPQRRFMRHWRNLLILATGYGAVMSAVLIWQIHPIYTMLLVIIMMTIFYALFSQNSYAERERYIQNLRPFILSQRLYDHLVTASVPSEIDVAVPFHALCGEVLGAELGYLSALGPLAPFAGAPLTYRAAFGMQPLSLSDLIGQFSSPQTMALPVEPSLYSGAMWAVPLWSERGLIGVFLLGGKVNGGLYTQEEIEIARASGERLIDTQASAEMARRLMALQRQRLAESQVADRRTRRILHDDVLPRIHAAMLDISAADPDLRAASAGVVDQLAGVHHQIADLLHEMPVQNAPAVASLGLLPALRKLVDDDLRGAFDAVTWQVDLAAETQAQHIPLLSAEVLYYAAREALRNAARYGRGKNDHRTLHLSVQIAWREGLQVRIEDDGVGLLENPPQPDGDDSYSGHGLALHSTMMAVVGGSLAVESAPGHFTRIVLSVPGAG